MGIASVEPPISASGDTPGVTASPDSEYILLRHRQIPDLNQLTIYQKNAGFEAFRKVVTSMQPAELIDLVWVKGPWRGRLPHRYEMGFHR
jgi:NADH:ubiquinone oxidoreductase subunit F (NADH-binding)